MKRKRRAPAPFAPKGAHEGRDLPAGVAPAAAVRDAAGLALEARPPGEPRQLHLRWLFEICYSRVRGVFFRLSAYGTYPFFLCFF